MTDLTIVDENFQPEGSDPQKKATVEETLEFVKEHGELEEFDDMVLLLRGEDGHIVLYTTLPTPELNLAIDNLKMNILGL